MGYNMDIMRQSACLVVNSIMVCSYGVFFNALHDCESGLRFNDNPDIKLATVRSCLLLGFDWIHYGSTSVCL